MRTVTLASGAVVTLGAYTRAWKQALAASPDARFRQGPADDFPDRNRTRAQVLAQFRRGMHDRINQATPYIARGVNP